jgi:uncharacterized phage protein (predicted DNA packaging)
MAKINLAAAKLHLRVTEPDEDTLITALIAAAYLSVEGRIFRKVYDTGETIPEEDTTGIRVNEAINAAVLLIVGHLYANREDVITGATSPAMPMGSEFLITPYINFAGGA